MLLRPLEPAQYTSIRFTEHLELEGIAPSIGSVGDAYDNALMESIIGLFKTEAITTTVFHDGPYKTLADAEYATAELKAKVLARGSRLMELPGVGPVVAARILAYVGDLARFYIGAHAAVAATGS